MLQTWRLNSKGHNETHQQQAFDPHTARPITQQACDSCRIKKLRCSGEKSGCFRCQNLSQDCVYASNNTKGSARTRKNRESLSKINRNARKSSISTSSASSSSSPSKKLPSSKTASASPHPEALPANPNVPNSKLPAALSQPETKQGDMEIFDIDIMLSGAQDYMLMESLPTTQTTGLGSYQINDTWPLSWPESTHENRPAPAKAAWEGAEVSHSLPSLGGWGIGIQSYDDTPLTSATGILVSELVAPLTLPPQTTTSQHGGDDNYWLHSQTHEPCQCLQRVVFLLEELDAETVDMNVKELGPWLSRHKEALRCSEALLMCPLCQAKPEHMTILAFLTDRLIAMCDNIISAYLMTLAGSVTPNLMGPKDRIWVGGFEIDSPHEWSAVVKTMLVMQLRGLAALMVRFRDALRSIGGEGGRRKADSTEERIAVLLEKLNASQRDLNGSVVSLPLPPP